MCLPSSDPNAFWGSSRSIHKFLWVAPGIEYWSSFSVVPTSEGFSLFIIIMYSTIGKKIRSSTLSPPIIAKRLTQKVQLTAGICAAKALVQYLCKRFHDPENVHIFIPGVSILDRHKFCVQEVLMHVCLLSFLRNALFGLNNIG